MSIPSDHLATFRTQWANRLIHESDIFRLPSSTDRGSIDAATLQYPSETLTPIYQGRKCLIRPLTPGSAPTLSDFGQQEVTYMDYAVYYAHDTEGLRVEDRIIATSVADDPDMVGNVYRISSISFDSYKTRLMVVATLDLGAGEQG